MTPAHIEKMVSELRDACANQGIRMFVSVSNGPTLCLTANGDNEEIRALLKSSELYFEGVFRNYEYSIADEAYAIANERRELDLVRLANENRAILKKLASVKEIINSD